jgi:hypothetical protein
MVCGFEKFDDNPDNPDPHMIKTSGEAKSGLTTDFKYDAQDS